MDVSNASLSPASASHARSLAAAAKFWLQQAIWRSKQISSLSSANAPTSPSYSSASSTYGEQLKERPRAALLCFDKGGACDSCRRLTRGSCLLFWLTPFLFVCSSLSLRQANSVDTKLPSGIWGSLAVALAGTVLCAYRSPVLRTANLVTICAAIQIAIVVALSLRAGGRSAWGRLGESLESLLSGQSDQRTLGQPITAHASQILAREGASVVTRWRDDLIMADEALGREDLVRRGTSIVLAGHNENQYVERTLQSIVDTTAAKALKEIIIVDDASSPPLAANMSEKFRETPLVRIVRNEERLGLIQSKQLGGNAATGDFIVFLDLHVKPTPGWLGALRRDSLSNPKRIAVPAIPILNGTTWEQEGSAVGYKMMFDWDLSFNWFEDDNDVVPCMSGGLLGLTREWWEHTGGLDDGMQVWGAENIEQSVRTWLSGGEIVVSRQSRVLHVFRPSFPYTINFTKVNYNKVRLLEVWFDHYKEVAYKHAKGALRHLRRTTDPAALADARALRKRIAKHDFAWYTTRFRDVFIEKGMIPVYQFLILPMNAVRNVTAAFPPTPALSASAASPLNLGSLSASFDPSKCLTIPNEDGGTVVFGSCDSPLARWHVWGGPLESGSSNDSGDISGNISGGGKVKQLLNHDPSHQTSFHDEYSEMSAVVNKHLPMLRNNAAHKCLRPERSAAEYLEEATKRAPGTGSELSLSRCFREIFDGNLRDWRLLDGFYDPFLERLLKMEDAARNPRLSPRLPPNPPPSDVQLRWGSLCLTHDADLSDKPKLFVQPCYSQPHGSQTFTILGYILTTPHHRK